MALDSMATEDDAGGVADRNMPLVTLTAEKRYDIVCRPTQCRIASR